METPKPNPLSFTYFLRPVISLADEIHSAIFPLHAPPDPSTYDCNNDRQKAEAIAENLVRDWTLAKQLVKSYGENSSQRCNRLPFSAKRVLIM